MNNKTRKRLEASERQDEPKDLGPKALARAEKRAKTYQQSIKRHQESLRLREYVSVGDAELKNMYNTAAQVKVQGKVALVPRRSVMPDCPFDQDLKGELVVMRSVAEMLELEYTELTGDKS